MQTVMYPKQESIPVVYVQTAEVASTPVGGGGGLGYLGHRVYPALPGYPTPRYHTPQIPPVYRNPQIPYAPGKDIGLAIL